MRIILVIGFLSILTFSCTIGKLGVSYNEMTKQPTVQINDNMVIVHTDNSSKNSGLLIYKIDFSIDTSKKVIDFRGFQALNKDYKNSFEIQIKGISKIQLDKYDYFWIDPDNKKTRIEKIK